MELKQNPHSENPTKLKLISPALKHKLHVVTKDGIKHKWNYSKENFLSIAVSCLAQSEGVVWAMEMARQKPQWIGWASPEFEICACGDSGNSQQCALSPTGLNCPFLRRSNKRWSCWPVWCFQPKHMITVFVSGFFPTNKTLGRKNSMKQSRSSQLSCGGR